MIAEGRMISGSANEICLSKLCIYSYYKIKNTHNPLIFEYFSFTTLLLNQIYTNLKIKLNEFNQNQINCNKNSFHECAAHLRHIK